MLYPEKIQVSKCRLDSPKSPTMSRKAIVTILESSETKNVPIDVSARTFAPRENRGSLVVPTDIFAPTVSANFCAISVKCFTVPLHFPWCC